MLTFKYRAKKGPDIIEGTIEAQSEKEALERLGQSGILPIRIELKDEPPACLAGRQAPGVRQKHLPAKTTGRIRAKEITLFSRELASLLKSGVAILKSLNIISEQSENHSLKKVLSHIHSSVKDGATFSSSLTRYPGVFPPLYIAMVRAGEDGGALPQALLRITEYRAKQEEALSRFRMALAYPALMAVVGIGTIVFMFVFVMPRLMGMYTNLGQDLPLPTRMLISISTGLKQNGLWGLLGLSIAIIIINRQLKTRAGRLSWSIFTLRLPLLGKFILKAELARFSRTLELLIKNGITILRAIDISIPVLDNEVLKNQLKESYKSLEQGGSFGRSLKNSKFFPAFMSNLIIVGEESGKLYESLSEVADSYERDTDEAMKIMSSLLEPLMILGMGLIVGFMVIAMLLPIFELNVMAR
jgi:type II secretory pathway component PulF